MIAACPKCRAKFRIAKERLAAEGVRLRCTQCSTVFRVKAPEDGPVPAPAEPTVDAQPTPTPRSLDRERLVVVAISEPELGKQASEALEAWGLQALPAFDGVEAILAVQRTLPKVVVLDAALPKMYGFQVCELIKRNEQLRATRVVLVGAIHNDTRYRRSPQELYGADQYLETPDVPDGLHAVLAGFGMPLQGVAPEGPAPRAAGAPRGIGGIDTAAALEAAEPAEAEPAPAPAAAPPQPVASEPAPPPRVAPQPAAPQPVAPDDGIAQAERLARIIISDVILYNEEKFAAAIAAGNVAQAMEPDMAEGRALFQGRIDPQVVAQRDFLREELLRVAKQRGMV